MALAAPDGETIMAGTVGTHVTSVHLTKSLPYDPIKDFTPIVAAVEPVTCLVVHSVGPVNSVQELIAYAKSKPGELSYGTSGVGSVFHLMGELFNQTAGVKMQHVPYRGVGPAMQDVVAGHIPIVFTSVSTALPNMAGAASRSWRCSSRRAFAKLPTRRRSRRRCRRSRSRRAGSATSGPPGMPRRIVARLNEEIMKGLNAPDVLPKLEDNGYAVIGGTPEAFGALIRDGIERYGAIIKTAGIQAE